jgi:hypothetical protein
MNEHEAWSDEAVTALGLARDGCASLRRFGLIIESGADQYPVYDFEYYLIDEEFTQLIADTDHNEIIVAKRV